MSQADFIVDGTQTRTNWVIEANQCWQALASNNSGSTAPSTTYAYQTWFDTAQGLIKVRDASNTGWNTVGIIDYKNVTPQTNGFRLGVVSGSPLANASAVSTLYLTPYTGNVIALYDNVNTIWKPYYLNEQSITIAATANTNYDVFAYDNGSGSVVFEQLAWTSDTVRATALTTQNGVWVKSGATNRRYIGTFRASATNTTDSSLLKRLVFNASNRVLLPFRYSPTATSYSAVTSSGTPFARNWANSANSRVPFVVGLQGAYFEADVFTQVLTGSNGIYAIGVNIDISSAINAECAAAVYGPQTFQGSLHGNFKSSEIAVGYHTAEWVEVYSSTGGTTAISITASTTFGGNTAMLSGKLEC
jgi:hypothetical protein